MPSRSIGIIAAAVLILVVIFGAVPAFANTYIVTNLNDSGPGSLRAAIASATSGMDTINFSSSVATGDILLQSTLQVSASNENLTITGPGASSLAISGNGMYEVLSVGEGTTVTISGLIIQDGYNGTGNGGGINNNGTLNLSNCIFSSNSTVSGNGAAIYNAGTLTITNCSVFDNLAAQGSGGGIYSASTGTLTVTNSNVSGNMAPEGFGAGISSSGMLTLSNSTVSGNTSGGDGGGIFNGGTMVMSNSTVSGNIYSRQGGGGGGIFNAGSLTITNSTISGNLATSPYASGGGIYINGGMLTITNSTISGNSASATGGQGGGIYIAGYSPTSTVTSSTLWDNIVGSAGGGNVFSGGPSPMIFQNSIVGGSGGSGGNCGDYSSTAITSQGYNLSDDTSCNFGQMTDVITVAGQAGLANILQNNGGPTQTIALFSYSPAVGAIPANDCSANDQRGVTRPQVGVNCDIGAFELQNLQALAWGADPDGELGNGMTTPSGNPTPAQVLGPGGAGNLTGVVAVAAGGQVSLALESNGSVWAWGDNSYGELGNGTFLPANSATPTQVLGLPTDIVAIAAGANHGLALESNGSVWAWGRNAFGQLGNGAFSNSATPAQVMGGLPQNIVAIAAGSNHSMALTANGMVWTWGYNYFGGLGNGTTTTTGNYGTATPAQVVFPTATSTNCMGGAGAFTGVVAIAGGLSQSLALEYDGVVYAWGSDSYGELGNGTTMTNVCAPVQVVGPVGGGPLSNVMAVAAGTSQSMALTGDGSVWDWGYGSSGQLGNGSNNNSDTPVQVIGPGGTGFLSGVTAISGGGFFSSALMTSGGNQTAWAWGNNYYGQLGNGTTTATGCNCISTPVQVVDVGDNGPLTGVTAISAGGYDGMALVPATTALGGAPIATFSTALSPPQLSFGSVPVNTTATESIVLQNTGTAALVLQLVSWLGGTNPNGVFSNTQIQCNFLPGPLTSIPAGFTIDPGDNCIFVVQFDPNAVGNFSNAGFVVEDNAAQSNLTSSPLGGSPPVFDQVVPVSGTGAGAIATFSPANPNFANAILDQTSTAQSLTLTNTGTAPLILMAAFVTPDNILENMAAFGYSSANITCNGAPVLFVPYETPLTINPNVSCIIPLLFDPTDENLSAGTSGTPAPVAQSDTIIFDDNALSSNAPNVLNAPNSQNYTQTITVSGTFSYGAKVQVTSSASAADVGTPVTFTAFVTPLSSFTPGNASPTGTVTFLDGQGSLGMANVSVQAGGVIATLTTSSLPVGADIITANYSGDANYAGETTVSGITVTVGNANYSISANPSSLTLAAGQSGSTVITLTPASPQGYDGPVILSCGSLPSYITCAFSSTSSAFTPPSTVTLASGVLTPQPVTLNVSVAANIAMLDLHRPFLAAMALPLGLLGLLPIVGRKRKHLRLWIVFAALTVALGGAIAGCGSSTSSPASTLPPAGAQNFTVTASGSSPSGTTSQQLQLTINITN